MSEMPWESAFAKRLLVVLPLAGFLAVTGLFVVRLGGGDPSRIPSALIGRPAPAVSLPPVPGLARNGKPLPGIEPAAFQGRVGLVNVWASWCVPCHDEVPFLERLGQDPRIRLVGLNYTPARFVPLVAPARFRVSARRRNKTPLTRRGDGRRARYGLSAIVPRRAREADALRQILWINAAPL